MSSNGPYYSEPPYRPGTKTNSSWSAMQLIPCYPVSDHPSPLYKQHTNICNEDQGQGGAQAIEDSVALGIALTGCTPELLESRLKIFQEIRMNRAGVMQIFSNAGQDEPDRIRAEAAKFIPADDVPSK